MLFAEFVRGRGTGDDRITQFFRSTRIIGEQDLRDLARESPLQPFFVFALHVLHLFFKLSVRFLELSAQFPRRHARRADASTRS